MLITEHLCCCPKPCQCTSEYSPGRWAAITLNTCSCVPLQKQTTTIILISALFRPLQQSSRLSSEDTWESLLHHRDHSKHIVDIALCSPFWFSLWQQCQRLAFNSCLTLSVITVQSRNHHHREVKQNKGTLAVHHLDRLKADMVLMASLSRCRRIRRKNSKSRHAAEHTTPRRTHGLDCDETLSADNLVKTFGHWLIGHAKKYKRKGCIKTKALAILIGLAWSCQTQSLFNWCFPDTDPISKSEKYSVSARAG